MQDFDPKLLKKLKLPKKDSHKGQNGKVMVIGGSRLFHAASLWALKMAAKIADMVFYHSVEENLQIVQKFKEEFRDGIIVRQKDLDSYLGESEVILIGSGLPRAEDENNYGISTADLLKNLLKKYPQKKYVLDASALQEMEPEWITEKCILTPHAREFRQLSDKISKSQIQISNKFQNPKFKFNQFEDPKKFAVERNCTVLLKGMVDVICSKGKCAQVVGGNAGMTKGGTGDVLAGLVAGLYAQNDDPFLVATCASFINKKAGEDLFKKVGYWFNASDLLEQVPRTMKKLLMG